MPQSQSNLNQSPVKSLEIRRLAGLPGGKKALYGALQQHWKKQYGRRSFPWYPVTHDSSTLILTFAGGGWPAECAQVMSLMGAGVR